MSALRPCVFFDRDGIVNTSPGPGYVASWSEFHLQPAFVAAAQVAARHGFACVVITNQRGIARGIVSAAAVEAIHANLTVALADAGAPLQGIYMCPHERDTCACRKPLPGLLLRAAREQALDLERSWMVGDQPTDIAAGRAVGCRTVLVNAELPIGDADYRLDSMPELPPLLESLLSA
jgi:D-glycero-D-manno-heptose 1,7-bisphosphate phosphatase